MKKIFVIAGEASGDLYAKEIIKKLQNNNVEVFAMGSKNVQETHAKIIQDSTELSVTGIIEILKVYSKIKKALDNIKKNLLIEKPDLLILIDYQEFNFRLAKFAKTNGIKVLFFIGPQFWAWRPKRINKFKNIVDKMAVIFPFEKEPYRQLGIDVSYVGHPLINLDTSFKDIKKKFNKDSLTVGFFPGSRVNEIKRLSPIFK